MSTAALTKILLVHQLSGIWAKPICPEAGDWAFRWETGPLGGRLGLCEGEWLLVLRPSFGFETGS